ncbi:hemerythrin domain-containing protein [Pendulispora rubella]|uniref:Hemerythrin domain-containing protein n=1 Tax=Pendulispora rubella TaxID=2741070 RepID=A0ABZ2L8F3_9BACT
MKATTLLREQHQQVKGIFEKLEKKNGNAATLVRQLANALAGHMAIEQQLFYPAIREVDKDHVDEGYEEHAVAELELKRLLRTDPADPNFKSRVTVLKELIEHHVKEEEQELFPKVEKKLDAGKLEALGAQLEKLFNDVQKDGYDTLSTEELTTTSSDTFRRAVGDTSRGSQAVAR